jgi:hypothetical protein
MWANVSVVTANTVTTPSSSRRTRKPVIDEKCTVRTPDERATCYARQVHSGAA